MRSDRQRDKAWARMIAAERQWRDEKKAGNAQAAAVCFEHYQRALLALRSTDSAPPRPSNIRLSRPLDSGWPR
jgi:hypothetical protein